MQESSGYVCATCHQYCHRGWEHHCPGISGRIGYAGSVPARPLTADEVRRIVREEIARALSKGST